MVRRNTFLSLVLMFCIGLAPLQGFAAAEPGHMETMTADCFDCEMHDDGSGDCAQETCFLLTGFCGTQNSMSPPPRLLEAPVPELALIVRRPPDQTRYRSRLNFSIYRPPIA